MFSKIISFIKEIYKNADNIPLHAPVFHGNEKKYLNDAIDSTFVSTVGKYVDQFENLCCQYTGSHYAIASVNGTAALHVALELAGVKPGDHVITQALSFVATANAISYCGGEPIFLDSDKKNLGMSYVSLETFLTERCHVKEDGFTYSVETDKKIAACVPMHVFGHPVEIQKICTICDKYQIPVVEDAAEAMGSTIKQKHAGIFGKLGVLSFNGNKIITAGGGGMILTHEEETAKKAKHVTTTAKIPHPWEYMHDQIGYNYRMPNINAALGCAQIEQLDDILANKRKLAEAYKDFFALLEVEFMVEPENSRSNYWLNGLVFKDLEERDKFLQYSNVRGVMTRPLWKPLSKLEMYSHCLTDELSNTDWLAERVVNIPSSTTPNE